MEYITRRKALYKSNVEFEDYALNHVEGCTHGCSFPCYARLIKKKTESDWRRIAIVKNVLELLDNEIPKLKSQIKQVHLCFSTDLFMYKQPEVITLSLKILKKLMESNIKVKTLTKGEIPSTEIIEMENNSFPLTTDLFEEIKEKTVNEYGITLVSLDEKYRKKYEPYTAPFDERIAALKKLADCKLFTYVYCEPFSPLITGPNEFKVMLERIKFVNKIYFGSWQYNSQYAEKSQYQSYVRYTMEFCKDNNIELKLKKEIAYLG